LDEAKKSAVLLAIAHMNDLSPKGNSGALHFLDALTNGKLDDVVAVAFRTSVEGDLAKALKAAVEAGDVDQIAKLKNNKSVLSKFLRSANPREMEDAFAAFTQDGLKGITEFTEARRAKRLAERQIRETMRSLSDDLESAVLRNSGYIVDESGKITGTVFDDLIKAGAKGEDVSDELTSVLLSVGDPELVDNYRLVVKRLKRLSRARKLEKGDVVEFYQIMDEFKGKFQRRARVLGDRMGRIRDDIQSVISRLPEDELVKAMDELSNSDDPQKLIKMLNDCAFSSVAR